MHWYSISLVCVAFCLFSSLGYNFHLSLYGSALYNLFPVFLRVFSAWSLCPNETDPTLLPHQLKVAAHPSYNEIPGDTGISLIAQPWQGARICWHSLSVHCSVHLILLIHYSLSVLNSSSVHKMLPVHKSWSLSNTWFSHNRLFFYNIWFGLRPILLLSPTGYGWVRSCWCEAQLVPLAT